MGRKRIEDTQDSALSTQDLAEAQRRARRREISRRSQERKRAGLPPLKNLSRTWMRAGAQKAIDAGAPDDTWIHHSVGMQLKTYRRLAAAVAANPDSTGQADIVDHALTEYFARLDRLANPARKQRAKPESSKN